MPDMLTLPLMLAFRQMMKLLGYLVPAVRMMVRGGTPQASGGCGNER